MLSKSVGRGSKQSPTNWNDWVELEFYCKVLRLPLQVDFSDHLEYLVEKYSALQHCPLRLRAIVARAMYIKDKFRHPYNFDG